YQDLSEKSKIPSSVISAFDTQPEPSPDEPPEIIKQEIQKKQTQKPTTKTTTTQPKTEEVKKETTTQTTTTEETINCPNCGAEVIKGERFCPICREQLIR
ncbi:MAG: zinc ribbon domain-containing protein, partial [Elusimicrobiota bacterium]|nr:zinc ribbon domain-containing protein [Endomicrobiia bacterium]MDW8166563.1 zinc ribbon domain-containing protein [Elusimicrobiota bacterium]